MRLSYSTLLAVAGIVTLCGVSHAQIITNFHANLDPCQVETLPDPCPPPGGTGTSTATGSATLVLSETGVEADNMLTFHVTFTGLTSPTTNGHIHGPAAIGVSAGVVRGFTANGTPPNTHVSPIDGVWRFTDAQSLTNARVAQLKAGLLYVNIHTQNYTGGEIRGQILLDAVPTAAGTWGRVKKIYR